MLVFGIGEDPFNGLLVQSIGILAALTLAQLLRQIQILLPDVGGQDAPAFCVGAAGLPAGAVPAVLRADKAVLSFENTVAIKNAKCYNILQPNWRRDTP